MEKLLVKPETRSAAVTMLGKTVQYCGDMVRCCSASGFACVFRSRP
jgi:hypothetical protein